MDEGEKRRLRREILDDVAIIFGEHLAADHWGRVLVEVVIGDDGRPAVAEMAVEGVVGDEGAVDAAFARRQTVGPLLPVIGSAVEALCGLDDVELERVGGGTFLRQLDGTFAWLPGLVRMPSAAFERAWDAAESALRTAEKAIEERFGLAAYRGYELDLSNERIVFASPGRVTLEGRATLIGSYSHASRTWAWGAQNAKLPADVRDRSARLVDAIASRDMWELSTPLFATDAATARALCALVCRESSGQGVYRGRDGETTIFVLLRDLRPSP